MLVHPILEPREVFFEGRRKTYFNFINDMKTNKQHYRLN